MKYIKVSLLIVLALLSVIGLSACSDEGQKRDHRLQWWLDEINWDVQSRTTDLSGKDVLIAVIDTAIDESHPDLKEKIVEQYVVDDVKGKQRMEHGTAVAGIICASPNNEDGVLGVAPDSKILSIVIAEENETNVESLVDGIKYAIQKKVDIINISSGLLKNDSKLETVINEAYNSGIIVVAASGNDLYGNKIFPAAYKNVISVNSVDSDGQKIYGGDDESIFLPGGNIVTTYSSTYESKKYVSYSGTSMSAPILTGVIALILEQNKEVTNVDILDYFKNYQNVKFDTVKILEDFDRIYK